jgi:hypothetical protein
LVTVILASGTPVPLGSVTLPVIVPRNSWASATETERMMKVKRRIRLIDIVAHEYLKLFLKPALLQDENNLYLNRT